MTYRSFQSSKYGLGMRPTIIDSDSGRPLWTAAQCAEYSGTARGTFTSYAGRGRAPEPVTKYQGLTLWDSEAVKGWHESRQQRGGFTTRASEAS